MHVSQPRGTGEGPVIERWVISGQYDQYGCVGRTQAAASVNVRCRAQVKASSEVGRRHAMNLKAAIIDKPWTHNVQPKCPLDFNGTAFT